ncbi:MAG: MauE/DoxX family redox-associated membrane protein [Chloroflexota bacterium]
MYQAFLLAFCQVVVGCVFAVSSFAKVKDFSSYLTAVGAFRLIPKSLAGIGAVFFLVCEILVVVLLFIWPIIAFSLAAILLLLFSVALTTVLLRGIQTTCNCFGSSSHPVSYTDLIRNVGLLLCAGGGAYLTVLTHISTPLTFVEWGVTALFACTFALIWTQIGEIVRLLHIEYRSH